MLSGVVFGRGGLLLVSALTLLLADCIAQQEVAAEDGDRDVAQPQQQPTKDSLKAIFDRWVAKLYDEDPALCVAAFDAMMPTS